MRRGILVSIFMLLIIKAWPQETLLEIDFEVDKDSLESVEPFTYNSALIIHDTLNLVKLPSEHLPLKWLEARKTGEAKWFKLWKSDQALLMDCVLDFSCKWKPPEQPSIFKISPGHRVSRIEHYFPVWKDTIQQFFKVGSNYEVRIVHDYKYEIGKIYSNSDTVHVKKPNTSNEGFMQTMIQANYNLYQVYIPWDHCFAPDSVRNQLMKIGKRFPDSNLNQFMELQDLKRQINNKIKDKQTKKSSLQTLIHLRRKLIEKMLGQEFFPKRYLLDEMLWSIDQFYLLDPDQVSYFEELEYLYQLEGELLYEN